MAKSKAQDKSKIEKPKIVSKTKTTAKTKPVTKPKTNSTVKKTVKEKPETKVNKVLPKALDLFQAYNSNQMPEKGGYIVSSFFSNQSTYSIYEIIAYDNVKGIFVGETGLTFQADGHKMFILVEPANYPHKYQEPFTRAQLEQIPLRFAELDIITAKNQTKLMVNKEPVISYSSFTIHKPATGNFSLIFYYQKDVLKTLEFFFTQTLNKEAGVPSIDTKKCARAVIEGIKKFKLWS
jgi:hypothetical protein